MKGDIERPLSGFHLEFFRWGGGKLQESLVPGPSFRTLLACHSYAKKEGLGMRLLRSLVSFGVSPQSWSTLPSFTFTLGHISGMQILGGGGGKLQ